LSNALKQNRALKTKKTEGGKERGQDHVPEMKMLTRKERKKGDGICQGKWVWKYQNFRENQKETR